MSWFKKNQLEDFGWPRRKRFSSHVKSTSESIDALITLGEDPNSPQIRKGVLWLIENIDVWGREGLKGYNRPGDTEKGLDDLCWGLIGLDRSKNAYVRKVFSQKLDLLLSRQVTDIKDDADKRYFGLFVERFPQIHELLGIYSSSLALKIMCKHFSINDPKVQNVVNGLKRYKTKDEGWPTRLDASREADPCYTVIVLDSLLHACISPEDDLIAGPLKFIENELRTRGCLWSEWIEEGFEKGDKREQISTEATGQALITLLKAGYDPKNEAIKKAAEWLLSDEVFVWKGEDKGGFRLFPGGPIFNYSTYYGSVALKTFIDVVESWEKLNKVYQIDVSKLSTKNKAALNRFLVDLRSEGCKPSVTISNLRRAELLNKTIRGRIADETTLNRIWYVLQMLDKKGPLTLYELEDQIREKTKFLEGKKRSWSREMFIVLSRINTQNLLIFYKKDGTIREVEFPSSEPEYTKIVSEKVKLWTRFDL